MTASETTEPVSQSSPTSIEDVFDSDVDGLLDAPEKPAKLTSSDRLERAFLEVVEFRRAHGRAPSSTTREIAERKLGARLDGILADEDKIAALRGLNEFGLLDTPEAPTSIDDLLGSDDIDLLGDDSGLLDVSDLPVRRQVYDSGNAARREKARDFDQFEPLFKQKHAELQAGTSMLRQYSGMSHIVEGAFFVLNGVMVFVAEVGEPEYKKTTVRENKRERLRCVFENGTESSMYRQSLAIRLSDEDGQIVAPADVPEILVDDEVSGYVYVLRSLSKDPQIAGIKDLHKIGFTRGSVKNRIKNAAKSPTYLMAPVEVVATYRTYNLRVSALENLLHQVFAAARLNLTQTGLDGRDYDPSEWFVVPRDVIDRAVDLIKSRDIVDWVYDANAQRLVERARQ
ncbi:GIY-YIG nuclease family protein [Tsukamurella tyrosinosolvens]|uniref:GIY-YIG nuclease family protein n=1 Tax=Tsukamurella TaxID=2060 RepID=UPI000E08D492|nr:MULTISPECIES: GIY-YIG nuclease family protein [Tsukamurella]MCA4997908.1 GIY-YIG nuclease family protein [Tsukamurella tyrosinosolvens]RDH13580.1 GIY-YIG nuclease family protein [Tsukamurella pulmonis]